MRSIFVTGYVNILDGRKRVFSIFSITGVTPEEVICDVYVFSWFPL